ncbi:TetR/AcrR family transcriptional regulator [Amycolatopsis acidiphila]|uniref:TetR/AcrR family transcriptional regulator n=1 Tax=Amycolatopsis acidiphila TaxID=715473 RepID=A0A558A6E4_9PSEU|nr:TetR/AcrR family transcriptional regulator [Amycolatopsis acidiphila]TVT19841.1 TetR/AcrR family transcriptional regulator [Amycolatopsis acidiphila]UIJ58749.1 TetR/AcrR family transcriptional regulator [Amycolatopsis acidiphila]GHG71704.1 TetR family transcriptional regulator [Amycolatopsis acidiphila]
MTVRQAAARERILTTAYELFSRRGIRAVGVDEVVRRAGVVKATLYRHFPSKDQLVLAFLARREQLWTREAIDAGARGRAATGEGRLLAVFDVLDELFHAGTELASCSFIKVLLEMGAEHPVGQACVGYLENVRALFRDWAEEAKLPDPAGLAKSWHLLVKGAIIGAAEGDLEAARSARVLAECLLELERAKAR